MRDVNTLLFCGILVGVGLGLAACDMLIQFGVMPASSSVVQAAGLIAIVGGICGGRTKRRIRLAQSM